ncbi:putative anti-sigma factor [Pedobacter sp. BAL39]|uniref:FecR family protein n=1 Tax=Pedobacter sp. BAL39 TaxID=391596 RepID=UPI000155AD95|nr:FecR family protein [Pedobacter sp. BAL39]EDM33861.1 putative anti-sigma factor [Pedobacter sp. BAL39]
MHSHVRLSALLARHFENNLTAIEAQEFSIYLENPVYAEEIKDLLAASFTAQTEALEMPAIRKRRVLKSVLGDANALQPLRRRIWFRAGLVAAILLCILTVGLFYNQYQDRSSDDFAYLNDIAPGKQGATLTLSNGSRIKLDEANNGTLAEEAGVKISKSADGQVIYEIRNADNGNSATQVLSTARGETYQLRLPDGSVVHLNAASSLTFSSHLLQKGKRLVKLNGEGFFDVAKDKAHPFVVMCKGQELEVLGTHFNVKAYAEDQKMVSTLVEGSVKVRYGDEQRLLKPGQQATNDGRGLSVKEVDVSEAIAWKEGFFRFNDAHVGEVMEQLARWYDIDVKYEGKLSNDGFSGKISRYKPISDVLKMLENTGLVKFKIEGRRVTVLE